MMNTQAHARTRTHARTYTESKDAHYFTQIGMNAARTHNDTHSHIPTCTHAHMYTHSLRYPHIPTNGHTLSHVHTARAHTLSHMGRYVSTIKGFFWLFILPLNSGQFAQYGSYLGIITQQQHHSERRALARQGWD